MILMIMIALAVNLGISVIISEGFKENNKWIKKELKIVRQFDYVFTCVPCAVRIGEGLLTPIKSIGKGFCSCEHIGIRDIGNELGWKEFDMTDIKT